MYGLEQSPKQRYKRFVYCGQFSCGFFIYLLLYVDDMLSVAKSMFEVKILKSWNANHTFTTVYGGSTFHSHYQRINQFRISWQEIHHKVASFYQIAITPEVKNFPIAITTTGYLLYSWSMSGCELNILAPLPSLLCNPSANGLWKKKRLE